MNQIQKSAHLAQEALAGHNNDLRRQPPPKPFKHPATDSDPDPGAELSVVKDKSEDEDTPSEEVAQQQDQQQGKVGGKWDGLLKIKQNDKP
jgi:hypothetical protein